MRELLINVVTYTRDSIKLLLGRMQPAQFCDRHGHLLRVIHRDWYKKAAINEVTFCVARSCGQTIIICDRCETIVKQGPCVSVALTGLTLDTDRMRLLEMRGVVKKGSPRDSDWQKYFAGRV